jgi:hypothetical protein
MLQEHLSIYELNTITDGGDTEFFFHRNLFNINWIDSV